MSDELQTLWQSQHTDSLSLPQRGEGWGEGPDFAVPTSQFGARRPSRRTAFFAIAAMLVVALGIGRYQLSLMRGNHPPPRPPPSFVERDRAEEVEQLLAECRTYSSSESGAPDFERAELACQRVLTLEPLHHEGATLLLRIATLRTCQSDFNRGMEASSSHPDEALDAFARVTKDCEVYFVRANGIAREMVPAALERAKKSCVDPLDEGCKRWVNLECQRSGLVDERVAAWSAAHRDWSCPSWFALRSQVAVDDGRGEARAELRARYTDPALGEVLVAYFDGDLRGARARAEALRAPEARALRDDVRLAEQLQLKTRVELVSISGPRIDRAAPVATEFFEVDARLMLGEDAKRLGVEDRKRALARFESVTRRELIKTLAQRAYEQGKQHADRKEFREACRAWKSGAAFSRSDLDLLKALTNVCTKKAADALHAATTCEALEDARDFAVEGDGYREQIEDELDRRGCR